jgi:hypothetical protein
MMMLLHSVRVVALLSLIAPDAILTAIGKHQYGYSWMQATIKAHQDADCAKSGPREELKTYLAAPWSPLTMLSAGGVYMIQIFYRYSQ